MFDLCGTTLEANSQLKHANSLSITDSGNEICDLQISVLKLSKISIFRTLEVVGRGSETQLQVGKNLKELT